MGKSLAECADQVESSGKAQRVHPMECDLAGFAVIGSLLDKFWGKMSH